MKKYRITKRHVDNSGYVYEPQEMYWERQYIQAQSNHKGVEMCLTAEEIQTVIDVGCDWLEEVKETEEECETEPIKKIGEMRLLDNNVLILRNKVDELIDRLNQLTELLKK